MVLKWFLHSHLTGKREHHPTLHTPLFLFAHLAAQYPIYKCDLPHTPPHPIPLGIFDLRRMSKMSNWTTPFRRIFGDNQSTKMASNWPLWWKAKHSQANRISRQHFTLSLLPPPPFCFSLSTLPRQLFGPLCSTPGQLNRQQFLQWQSRSSTFSAHRHFVATFWLAFPLSVDYQACNLLLPNNRCSTSIK